MIRINMQFSVSSHLAAKLVGLTGNRPCLDGDVVLRVGAPPSSFHSYRSRVKEVLPSKTIPSHRLCSCEASVCTDLPWPYCRVPRAAINAARSVAPTTPVSLLILATFKTFAYPRRRQWP